MGEPGACGSSDAFLSFLSLLNGVDACLDASKQGESGRLDAQFSNYSLRLPRARRQCYGGIEGVEGACLGGHGQSQSLTFSASQLLKSMQGQDSSVSLFRKGGEDTPKIM